MTLEDYKVLARLVVSTTTGAIQLWQQDQLQWAREEGLADIRAAEFVELPERKIIASGLSEETETFLERLKRQATEARDFPSVPCALCQQVCYGLVRLCKRTGRASLEYEHKRDERFVEGLVRVQEDYRCCHWTRKGLWYRLGYWRDCLESCIGSWLGS